MNRIVIVAGIVVLLLIFMTPIVQAKDFIIQNSTGASIFVVNGTTGYVGFGLINPLYSLHVSADVFWTGTLQGGNVPWARLTNHPSITSGSGLTGGGDLSASRTLSIASGGVTNLMVATNAINTTQIVDGTILSGDIADGTITSSDITGNLGLGWQNLTDYPNACGAGKAIQAIDDTLTCVDVASGGEVEGAGSAGYIAQWNSSTTINASAIYQSGTDIGIGTSDPQSKLEVVGTLNATDIVLRTNCADGDVLKWSAGVGTCGADSGIGSEADTLQLVTGRGNTTTHNLTIGASSKAQTMLDVVGDANVTGSIYEGGSTLASTYALQTTNVNAGTGLTGGGALSGSVTLNMNTTYLSGSAYDSRFINEGQADAVALGSGTTGEYVYNLTQGTGISITGGTGEGSTPTISTSSSVPLKNQAETISEDWTFSKNLIVAGNITYVNSETVNVNGSIVPPYTEMFNIGSSTNQWASIHGVFLLQDGMAVLDNTTNFAGDVSGTYGSIDIGSEVIGATELASTTVAAGDYGGDIVIPTYTVDADGRITAASNTTIRTGTTGVTGIVQLDNTISSTSDTTAATANATKTAYDTAAAKASPGTCPAGQAVQNTTTGGVECIAVASGGEVEGLGSAGYIAQWNSSTTLNASAIYQNGTSIGIGTTTPTEKLNVNGSLRVDNVTGSSILFANATSGYVGIGAVGGFSDSVTKLANPADLPANDGYGASFSPDGAYLAIAHLTTPFVTIYKRSGDTFTKLANPADLPANDGWGASFSPDGAYLAIAHYTTPFVTIYKRSGDTFTKLANPADLPANVGYGASFSPDSAYLAIAHYTTPFVTIYKGSGGPIHKLELASHTTADGGIAFGKELKLYRSSPGILSLASGGSLNIPSGNLYVGSNLGIGTISAQGLLDVNGLLVVKSDGNVGIGTTTPQKTLDIVGDANATGYVYGMTGLCIGTDCKTDWSQITGTASQWDNSSTQTFMRAGYPLVVNVSNTLFVNGTSERVGIGTSNPQKTLHVAGDGMIVSNDSTTRSEIYWDSTNNRLVIRVN